MFKQIDRLQHDRPERAAFQAYARAKLRPVLDRIGWDAPRPEGDGIGALRAQLVRTLGRFGDEEVLTEARHRFAALQQRPQSLRPSLRDADHPARRHRGRPQHLRHAAGPCPQILGPRARALLCGGRERARSGAGAGDAQSAACERTAVERDRQHAQRDGLGRRPRRAGLGIRAQELQDAGRPAGLVVPQLLRSEPDEELQRPVAVPTNWRASRRCTQAPVPARPPRRRKATSGSTPT